MVAILITIINHQYSNRNKGQGPATSLVSRPQSWKQCPARWDSRVSWWKAMELAWTMDPNWLVVLTCFNHLEKWWSLSLGRMTTHIWNGKLKNVWNHQPANYQSFHIKGLRGTTGGPKWHENSKESKAAQQSQSLPLEISNAFGMHGMLALCHKNCSVALTIWSNGLLLICPVRV